MEQDFYRERLASHGLSVLVPDADGRADVHRIIHDELCRGVVLGCTEIELLIDPDRTPELTIPLFPTTRLHALAAVDAACARYGSPHIP